jgi:hypothetical protein
MHVSGGGGGSIGMDKNCKSTHPLVLTSHTFTYRRIIVSLLVYLSSFVIDCLG